jgi:hypothetical protein
MRVPAGSSFEIGAGQAASPGAPKGVQAQKIDTVTHNSVFADIAKYGTDELRLVRGNRTICRPRGHSSVGRAVALQAIGQGFESPCLQALPRVWTPRVCLGRPEEVEVCPTQPRRRRG